VVIKVLAVLFFTVASLFSQTTTVTIHDSNGNQAVGTITDGNVYFHDNNGNIAFGSVRNGNVFLNTNNGEVTFGTIKNGNVSLTDKEGITTGAIKNGNIFLNNSDGSVTVGTYDKSGNSFTNTTSVPASQTTQQGNAQLQQQIQQNNANAYAAGYAAGYGITNAIIIGAERHKMNSFCKTNPTSIFVAKSNVFSGTLCKDASFNQAQQEQIDSYCKDHPGHETGIGLHNVTCFAPPAIPNLKWAKWEMDGLHKDYEAQLSLNNNAAGVSQSRASWTSWESTYCTLAKQKASYKDLEGKKQRCD
jgi:hypothetical protein